MDIQQAQGLPDKTPVVSGPCERCGKEIQYHRHDGREHYCLSCQRLIHNNQTNERKLLEHLGAQLCAWCNEPKWMWLICKSCFECKYPSLCTCAWFGKCTQHPKEQ